MSEERQSNSIFKQRRFAFLISEFHDIMTTNSDPQITHDSALPSDDLEPLSYLAKPSGTCCITGSIHSGSPQGSFTSLSGVETYISRPPKEKTNGNILLYFPDVWGMFPNSLLIMDAFADAGYLVLGIDYFRGDPVYKHRQHANDTEAEPGFDYEAWKAKHTSVAADAVPKWVQAAKQEYGKPGTKFACVGYCFGAPYVCDQLADSGICTAGAFAHPAFLKEHHFRNLRRPLFLSCADVDHTFDTESRNKAIGVMLEAKVEYHVQLFSGVQHGFAMRGNMEDKYERWVKEKSLSGIVEWLDFWLDVE